jgi:dTDP-4-dehydrorhamnose reductase
MNQLVNIIGANSAIGSYLYNEFKRYFEINGTYHTYRLAPENVYLDITNSSLLESVLLQFNNSTVIILSAVKDIKQCEEDYRYAMRINVQPVQNIIEIVEKKRLKIKLIFFSSDYVFEGTKGNYTVEDKQNPQTNYGRTKAAAERMLMFSNIEYKIIRISAVMGPRTTFFVWLLDVLKKCGMAELYSNIYFTPTPINFLALAVKEIIYNFDFLPDKILHVSGDQRLSRYDFAQKIQRLIHTNAKLIPVEKNIGDNIQIDLSLVQSEYIRRLNTRSLDDYLFDLLNVINNNKD